MLTQPTVARTLLKSCNLADLASQLRLPERELRSALLGMGLPTDFTELRDELAQADAPGELLPKPEPYSLLESAAHRSKDHAVTHHNHYKLEVPDAPVLITFWGDWHVGEAGTDHIKLRDDAQLLVDLRAEIGPSSVLIGMGDYIGGYMRSKTPANGAQVLDPREQRTAAVGLLELTRPELILQGDHDEWHTRQDDNHEWLQDLCSVSGLRYAQWGAGMDIMSSGRRTRVLARHRFAGSRGANPYLPQINCHSSWGPADVVALAHVHSNPGVSLQTAKRISEGRFHAVQSGTYKVFDDYGKKLGVGNGEYGVPSVLVFPDGEVLPYNTLSDAARAARAVCK